MIVFLSRRMPPSHCAIGDLSVLLGEWLVKHGQTVEAIAWEAPPTGAPASFPCVWLPAMSATALARALAQAAQRAGQPVDVCVQTSQYDLHPWALAGWMAGGLQAARHKGHVRHIHLTLHEIYLPDLARRREWFLRPLQIFFFRRLLALVDSCRVPCASQAERVRRLRPDLAVRVQPVFSHFGEPDDNMVKGAPRDAGRWVVFGSHGRILDSLESLAPRIHGLMENNLITHLEVFGGKPTPAIADFLRQPGWPVSQYDSYIPVEMADRHLLLGHAMWLDYREAAQDPSLLGKSTVLAAALAHGVLPVLAHDPAGFAAGGEPLPHWYSVSHPPPPAHSAAAAAARMANLVWYRRHAAIEVLARSLAQAYELPVKP